MYRNADFRKYQIFSYAQWPGGLFGSPSMAGTRPGENDVTQYICSPILGIINFCLTFRGKHCGILGDSKALGSRWIHEDRSPTDGHDRKADHWH